MPWDRVWRNVKIKKPLGIWTQTLEWAGLLEQPLGLLEEAGYVDAGIIGKSMVAGSMNTSLAVMTEEHSLVAFCHMGIWNHLTVEEEGFGS